jgi:cytochrome c-type biogenesis protein CcmE
MTETLPPLAPPRLVPTRTRVFVVGALLVAAAGFGLLTARGIGKNLVYYWGPTELRAHGDQAVGATIRLGGLVAPGSVVRTSGVSGVEFDVIDREGGRVHVRNQGVPPQMFRESIGVVVEGTLAPGGHFEGHRLMISHSNEYRVPGEGGADVKRLMKTTEGLETAPGSEKAPR